MGALTTITVVFDEWTPDVAPLANGSTLLQGVIPAPDGYAPLPVPVVQGPAGLPDASLLFNATTPDGFSLPLAFTKADIHRAGATSWVPVGRAAGYSAAVPWAAVRWGDIVIAANGQDVLQSTPISAPAFADIPGVDFSAAYLDIVGEFVVSADIREGAGATRYPSRVRWSGFQRPLDWAPSPSTQSAWVDRPRIGRIMGVTGGAFGLVLGEDGLDRFDYVGLPTIWQFATLETDIGCDLPRSVVQVGATTYWHSKRGWRSSSGGPSTPIGHGKVDEWTRSQLDFAAADLMSAVPLLEQQCIVWSFVSHASSDGLPDQWLIFHWVEQRWVRAQVATTVLGRAATPDVFTDDAAIPGLGPLTDDDANGQATDTFGGGGAVQPAALVGGSLAVIQSVDGQVCRLVTGEKPLIPGRRAKVTRLQPLVDGVAGGLSGFIEVRDDQAVAGTQRYGPFVREVDGSLACNVAGRFHRYELQLVTPFQKAMGLMLSEITDVGRR